MAVWVEDNGADNLVMALESTQVLTARNIPQADGAIMRTTDQQLTIGGESKALNFTGMPRQGADNLTARNIPQTNDALAPTASQHRAIRTKGQRIDRIGMFVEDLQR